MGYSFNDMFGALGPVFGLVVFAVLVAWAILLFCMPFFVYGAWQRAKECSQRLDTVIALLKAQLPVANRAPE